MPQHPSALTDQRQRVRARTGRLAIGVTLALSLLIPAAAGPAAPVAAAGSCTGWGSTSHPPQTIRVLRASGRVEVVDFKRYVVVVTAKEWPSYIPQAAIETGAAAVKQYGWMKTLAGNHRSSFVTSSGKCYDVVDSTRDQLYRPESARVNEEIRRAVDATWGLSLRKHGRFFETGYRTGSSTRCGKDANGRLLYARSVIDCARRGMSRQEIQFRYYGRSLTLHWTDGRVITFSGGSQAEPPPKPQTTPTPAPATTPKPAPRSTPRSTPRPRPERARRETPRPTATLSLSLPSLVGVGSDEPSSVLIWLPGASETVDGAIGQTEVSMATVYSIPGTLLQLPWIDGATDGDTWPSVCTTSVGALPVGVQSYLALLPPPFGCSDAGVGSAPVNRLAAAPAEPVLARVFVDVDRAWVIY